MTEQELRNWFATQPAQPQDFVEETVRLTSVAHMKELRLLDGRVLTDEEAEEEAKIARRGFVEGIRLLKAGGALSPDM